MTLILLRLDLLTRCRIIWIFLVLSLLTNCAIANAATIQEVPVTSQDITDTTGVITHKFEFTSDAPIYVKYTVTQNKNGKDQVEDLYIKDPTKSAEFFYYWKSMDGQDPPQHTLWVEVTSGLIGDGKSWVSLDPPAQGGFVKSYALSLGEAEPVALNVEQTLFSYSITDSTGTKEQYISVKVMFSTTEFQQ